MLPTFPLSHFFTFKQMANRDKLNNVDYRWYVMRTQPRQERKLADMLSARMSDVKNILEVYCPQRSSAGGSRGDVAAVLFPGFVFVLATQQAVVDFIGKYYPEGAVVYDRKRQDGAKAAFLTVPEGQMRLFKDFNENYADRVIILERPYSDYAFNPKTNEPNEIVKVVDGPLKGCEGYLTRFNRERRLVFNVKSFYSDRCMAVSIPDVWSLHVVRLHNAEGDRQTLGTVKERAVDLLAGMLQGCGYGSKALPMLYSIVDGLVAKPSLVGLRKSLAGKGHAALAGRLAELSTADAELILNLVRYEGDNPGYVRAGWPALSLRPFLTPTAGIALCGGEGRLAHEAFTEYVRRVGISELAYYPSKGREETLTSVYYAHVGVAPVCGGSGRFTVFANWDSFLGEYFHTAGWANERLVGGTVRAEACDGQERRREKLIESFRNFAPTLYRVLADESSPVKAVEGFGAGGARINVMAVAADVSGIDSAADMLITTCVDICREINSTARLPIWRRYLRSVWLHE